MKQLTQTRYATVASTAALVIALGGTSYAAVLVTGADIKNGTVQSKDVKDKTLKLKDFGAGAKKGLKGEGRTGAAGPAGAKGDPGPAGAAGAQGIQGLTGPSNAKTVVPAAASVDITDQVNGQDVTVAATGILGGDRTYVMIGKVRVNNTSGGATNVRCSLTADDETDISMVRLEAGGIATLPLQVSDSIPGLLGIMRIRCHSFGATAVALNRSLTAIEVGTLVTDT